MGVGGGEGETRAAGRNDLVTHSYPLDYWTGFNWTKTENTVNMIIFVTNIAGDVFDENGGLFFENCLKVKTNFYELTN